jgi:hypothetical protein
MSQKVLRELNVRWALTTGVASANSVIVGDLAKEDTILAVLELAGAGNASITGVNLLRGNIVDQGNGWIQLDKNTNGSHLLIEYHDASGDW